MGLHSDLDALVAFAGLMILLVVISNFAAAVSVWAIFRFSFGLGAELQNLLFASHLLSPFDQVARRNSNALIASITQGASRFAFNVAQPLLVITSQATIIVVVVSLLVWLQPGLAVAFAGFIVGAYLLAYLLLRRLLHSHGQIAWRLHEHRQRLLAESLGGLKEIRLAGLERFFLDSFADATRESRRSDSVVGLAGDLPRFVLESVAFSALLGVAITLLRADRPVSEVLGVLSLYAVTGYRVLPAAQSIFKAASQLRSNAPVLEEMLPDILEGRRRLAEWSPFSGEAYRGTCSIQISDIHYRYPSTESDVLSGLSACVPGRSLTVLAGVSGAGKSTLADLLLGLLRPTSGSISVDGADLHAMGGAWQRCVGYVPQSIFLLDASVASNVAFGTHEEPDVDRVFRALDRANLGDFVRGLPGKEDYRIGENGSLLSGGQRQRLGIARALYREPSMLVLDEATSALDGESEAAVLETLQMLSGTITVLMIAHRASTIRAADHVILLRNGRLETEGTFRTVLKESAYFRSLVEHPTPSPQPEVTSGGAL